MWTIEIVVNETAPCQIPFRVSSLNVLEENWFQKRTCGERRRKIIPPAPVDFHTENVNRANNPNHFGCDNDPIPFNAFLPSTNSRGTIHEEEEGTPNMCGPRVR